MKYKASPLPSKAASGLEGLHLKPEHFVSPILEKLNDLAVNLIGMRLVVVYPTGKGLEQVAVGTNDYMNPFCKLIQSKENGAEHCRMCHLVMTKSSRSTAVMAQRCHTGASALVRLVSGEEDSSLGVLSSCCFVGQDSAATWPMARRRGKALGIDEATIKKAFQQMVTLDPQQTKMAHQILDIAGDALKLIIDGIAAGAALEKAHKAHVPEHLVTTAVENALQHAASTLHESKLKPAGTKSRVSGGASVIDIISELVASKPYLPFNLRTVSAAIQITSNHFSHLFHKQHKVCFSEYLTEQRLNYSKTLLKDLALNIAEVALKSGFHDAGYFTRRFKQKTGLTPREWRLKLERD